MALSENEREQVARGLMAYWSKEFEELTNMQKSAIRQAVIDTDDWLDANQVGFNNALNVPFKDNATLDQKALTLCVLTAMRISAVFARSILGGLE